MVSMNRAGIQYFWRSNHNMLLHVIEWINLWLLQVMYSVSGDFIDFFIFTQTDDDDEHTGFRFNKSVYYPDPLLAELDL